MRAFLNGPFVKGIVGGAIGILLMLVLVHVYFDHKGFHELVDAINKAAAAGTQKPAAP